MIRNVQTAYANENHTETSVVLIKSYEKLCLYCWVCLYLIEAIRTYFKTRKSSFNRKSSGKQAAFSAAARKRQRRHNVSNGMAD